MEYDKPDYKLGVEYDLSDSSMFFADLSTSYRINGAAPNKVIPPERLKAYTVGTKNRFWGNKLQLNASAYYYDYKNFFTIGDPVNTLLDENENGQWDPGEDQFEHDLGQLTYGDATIYGFDLQTSTIISANDRLDLSISYVNKKFADIIFDYYPQTNWLGLEDMSYNGMKMTNAPPWTVTFEYSHNFNLPNGGVLTPRLNFRFSSGYCLTWQAHRIDLVREGPGEGLYTYYFTKTPRGNERFQESYRLGDISMTYADPSGKWTLNFYVKNLENYALKRSLQGPGGDELRLGPPRTFGAILSVRY
jgi:iron complex outermembrane receptor protein